jgi:hypothetical protein
MAKKDNLTPSVLVAKLRENMNTNGTLKAQFKNHFLGKLSEQELNGIKKGLDEEIENRKQQVVNEKIRFLEEMGYRVSKEIN